MFFDLPVFMRWVLLSSRGGNGMQDLFTYASLGTLAGAVAATVLVVDSIKKFGF